MILIDSNALLVLILGLMNPRLINTHKRTSIYEEQDYNMLLSVIGKLENLVVLPNVWTEVDNLLNKFDGGYKVLYLEQLKEAVNIISEIYIPTIKATSADVFIELGVTDTLLLLHAKDCQFLITSDSSLSDYARANNVAVHDMKAYRNSRL